MKIFIDFETRSFADLKAVGAWRYSEHETTDIICMAYKTDLDPTPGLWRPGDLIPTDFEYDGTEYVARNALFEIAVAWNVAIPRYGFPGRMYDLDNWHCTAAMSRRIGLPGGLAKCAIALKLEAQKDSGGAALIRKYSVPVKNRATGKLEFKLLGGADRQAMYNYCMQDVKTDMEAFRCMFKHKNHVVERDAFLLDLKINCQGLRIDVPALEKVSGILDQAMEEAEKRNGQLGVNVRSVQQMKDEFKRRGQSLPNLQIDTVLKKMDELKDANPFLSELLELRWFLGKASVKKFKSLLDRTSPDGRLRYFLRYFGAHTGRFSGEGFQPHNLPRTKTSPAEIDAVIENFSPDMGRSAMIAEAKKILPGLIIPDKGQVFLIGDFAAIEARGLAWLAGQENLLKDFAADAPIYEGMAARVYNKPVKAITKQERQLGKQIILGCGYGMSYSTFFLTCEKYGIEIKKGMAENAVKTYRETYPAIVNFWYALERAFRKAWAQRSTSEKVQVGKLLTLYGKNNYVAIILPSGRELLYHRVTDGPDGLSCFNHARDAKMSLYGGLLAENVTQAVCRDILVDRLLECDKVGLNPVLHVHDEIVCGVALRGADKRFKQFEQIMNTAPEWAKGFPLKTEVEKSERYHK